MKKIKYYTPIHGTNLRVDKFPELELLMPSSEAIGEHLVAQKVRISKGEKYQALQIFITRERFEELLKIIKQKTGKDYYFGYIDIVYDNQTNPIVQIAVRAKVEESKEKE